MVGIQKNKRKIEKLKNWKIEKLKNWKIEKLKNWKIEKLKNWNLFVVEEFFDDVMKSPCTGQPDFQIKTWIIWQ